MSSNSPVVEGTESWRPRDGDPFVSVEGLIFYTFGYHHPYGRVLAFLKYVPERISELFPLDWLDRVWVFRGERMLRPKTLFSPNHYRIVLEAFRRHMPHHVYRHPNLRRDVVAPPLSHVREAYTPAGALRRLLAKGHRDDLEEVAVRLVETLSESSGVPLEDFGIHGSICLEMHDELSDVDLAVYGGRNYLRVLETLRRLEGEGVLKLSRSTQDEVRRGNVGRFMGKRFVVNAVRKHEEIGEEPQATPVGPAKIVCRVLDNSEAMFRPAVYRVETLEVLEGGEQARKVSEVVSMVGAYRMYARPGEVVEVRGFLERAELHGRMWMRLVVGSAMEEEYMRCLG